MGESASDSEARHLLVARYGPRVFGLHMRLVGNRDAAEDLTQETLVRALGGLKTYRPEGKFQAWIFRIAINVARDWIRRRPHEPTSGLGPDADSGARPAPVAEDRPEARMVRRERAARVRQALARLAVADREVLSLRFYGGLSFKEIARATGEPLGTVLARAHRALRKLGDLLPSQEP
jgi:RNA polymerase sigma-70 factor (ECF subfamily)